MTIGMVNAVKRLRESFPEATGPRFRLIPIEEFSKEDIIRILMLNMKRTESELIEVKHSRDEWAKTAFAQAKCR